jgi:hypothetical protein
MMAVVVDNEPPDRLPAVPDAQPPALDPEQYRQFQEFQRFAQFQRFTAQQQAGEQPPDALPPGAGYPPPYPPHPQHPGRKPLWKIILGSWLVRRLISIAIVLGVLYLVYQHFFGGGGGNGSAGSPHPGTPEEKHVYPQGANNAVHYVYQAITLQGGYASDMCMINLNPRAQAEFADAVHANTCLDAVSLLHKQITDPTYGTRDNPYLGALPEPPAGQQFATISSCSFPVHGGPALGTFTLTREPNDQWLISGYDGQTHCAPTGSTTATPPTAPTG